MLLARRGFIAGLFAPAIIRTPGLLMPIKPLKVDDYYKIVYPWRTRRYDYGAYVDEMEEQLHNFWAIPLSSINDL